MCEMVKIINDIEIIGWFSDRDKLLDFKKQKLRKPFIVELISNYFHVFCENQSLHTQTKLAFGIPEKNGKMWYDECIRLCDYICGTIADFNFENCNVMSLKKNFRIF